MGDTAIAPGLERIARPLFTATIIVGSFLLFLTQPMIARMALPRLGGAPAVWNSAMLVYQALLLGGYAWAHWLTRLRPAAQAGVHLSLFAVAALWLPIGLSHAMPSGGIAPALWVPWFLVSSIGPLFLIVSVQAPLMQHWFALESGRGEPYALYAASNLGSFGGLLVYPLLVEPFLTLRAQSWLWSAGYGLLAVLLAFCAVTVRHAKGTEQAATVSPAPSLRRILHWLALATVPSGLMLSTTTHLTTDLVAMPLLWVVPLGLYLLSFVTAFADRRTPTHLLTRLAPLTLLIGGGFAFVQETNHPLILAGIGLLLLFTIASALHGELYRLRPQSDHLTIFYLVMAGGGVLGGIICALIAPAVFDWTYEHPLLLLAAALLIPQTPLWSRLDRVRTSVFVAMAVLALILSFVIDTRLWPVTNDRVAFIVTTIIAFAAVSAIGRRWILAVMLAALMLSHSGWSVLDGARADTRIRSYFGIYAVDDHKGARMLIHGTTIHGIQDRRPGRSRTPTSYYAPKSGVGQVMLRVEELYGPRARVGVVGLGTGTLSCYKRPGQSWTFFEIDPKMARLARDSGYFSFLSQCAPDARIALGDARVSLAKEPNGAFDVLAVDAFSSDAVPIHLLTREAVGIYGRVLGPDGVLLFHISNRFIDLRPVIAALAAGDGWQAALLRYAPDRREKAEFASDSIWVMLSRDRAVFDRITRAGAKGTRWEKVVGRPGFQGWTDDYASILPLLKMWER